MLWLLRRGGLSVPELEDAFKNDSGLGGLSGISADLRLVVSAADGGDPRAGLAYAAYLHRLRTGVAGMAAAMGRLDGVVFIGGVGENSGRLRRDASIARSRSHLRQVGCAQQEGQRPRHRAWPASAGDPNSGLLDLARPPVEAASYSEATCRTTRRARSDEVSGDASALYGQRENDDLARASLP